DSGLRYRCNQKDRQTSEQVSSLSPAKVERYAHLPHARRRNRALVEHQKNRIHHKLGGCAKGTYADEQPIICPIHREAAVQDLSPAQRPQHVRRLLTMVASRGHFRTLRRHPSARTHPVFLIVSRSVCYSEAL